MMSRLYSAPWDADFFLRVEKFPRNPHVGSKGSHSKSGGQKGHIDPPPMPLAAQEWAHDVSLDNPVLPGPLILQ